MPGDQLFALGIVEAILIRLGADMPAISGSIHKAKQMPKHEIDITQDASA